MTIEFSERIERVTPSATVSIGNAAAELEADGVDVVDLSVGEPDFPTPANVVEAGKEAIDAGYTGYAPSSGVPELREAIAAKLRADGLDCGPGNVLVTPGGKQALYELFQTLIDDGDEVVLLDPAWVSYEAMTRLAGGTLSRVDLAPHDFALEPALDDLAETVSDDTALLVVNSPSNPTGAVYSEAALEGVRDLAVEHDITAISDEIYKEVTYGTEARSLGSLSGMEDRTITLNGFSKAYSMTGWRLGYFAGPEEVVNQAGKLHTHSVTCATHFVQYAGIEALRNTNEAVAEMREAFGERRDLLCDRLAEQGLDVPKPEGAFYLMIPVGNDDGENGDDQQWCEEAIEEAHVATVPGSAFGTPGYARVSYAASTDRLEAAVERLAESDLI
jgi:aspartate aminotransferase